MERGGDARRAPAPVEAGDGEPRQRERVREVDHILPDRRLLRRARHARIEKSGRTVAAQIDGERTVSSLGDERRHAIVGMRIVRKAVEQDHRKAGRIAALVITNLQDAGANRLDRGSRRRLRGETFD